MKEILVMVITFICYLIFALLGWVFVLIKRTQEWFTGIYKLWYSEWVKGEWIDG